MEGNWKEIDRPLDIHDVIRKTVALIEDGTIDRVDKDTDYGNIKMYRVGKVIRIDYTPKE
jgi:hypothetical protein